MATFRDISNHPGDPRIGPPGVGLLPGTTGLFDSVPSVTDHDNPGLPTSLYLAQADQWREIQLCLGGNAEIRKHAAWLIPQLKKEKDPCYARRLQHVLYSPYLQRIINAAIGLILRKPIMLQGGDEEWWATWRTNVDRQGTSLDDYCRPLLLNAIAYGHCGSLADASQQEEVNTLADQREQAGMPYLQVIRPQQIIGWRETQLATGSTIEQVRIREVTTQPVGRFGVETVQQVRVLEADRFEVWRRAQADVDRWALLDPMARLLDPGTDWRLVPEASGRSEIGRIPLSVVYCGREGVLVSRPQLRDLAFVNLQHTRVQSKLLHALDVAGFPILTLMGWDDTSESVDADVTSALALPIGGAAQYVEPASSSFAATQEELRQLEEQMQTLGVSILARQKLVAETAESKQLDRADTNSLLATVSMSLEQALQDQVNLVAEFAGIEAPEVALDRNYGRQAVPYAVSDIVALYSGGVIDRELALELLVRGEILDEGADDLDEILGRLDEQDAQQLEEEMGRAEMAADLEVRKAEAMPPTVAKPSAPPPPQ